MKCIKCGHTMDMEASRMLDAEVRGEHVQVEVIAPHCSQCGRVVLTARGRRMYSRAAADAYRGRHELLQARQIDQMRKSLGMTWKQFAEYVGVGVATLKRWMRGEIQTAALDSLVRLKADPSYAQRALDELLGRLMADASLQTVEPATPRRTGRQPIHFEEAAAVTNSPYALAA